MTTHGQYKTALYKVWLGMRRRCSPKAAAKDRPYYFDRGIRVCEGWQDFKVFRDWALSNGHRRGLSIDRIDPDGDYEPANCRWSTPSQQAINSRKRSGTTSKYKGVSFFARYGKWRATITLNGKSEHLGYHDTEEEAAMAYQTRKKELH